MINFENVSVTYEADTAPTLTGLDLTIPEGELILLVGASGAGKSTLLGTVSGLVPHFTGGTLTGRVTVAGRDTRTHKPRELADVVGTVGQDPRAHFVTDTVEDELAYGMESLGLSPAVMRRRVEETLDLLGLADLRDRPIATLSGGQQQRVAIGSVLTTHPKVLVLDEPTSALDPAAAEQVLAVLQRLVHDLGTTVLMAEHRLERVIQYADRVLLLPGRGEPARLGAPEEIMALSPVHPPVVALAQLAGWHPVPLTIRNARRRAGELRAGLAGATPKAAAAAAAVPAPADPAAAPAPAPSAARSAARPAGLPPHPAPSRTGAPPRTPDAPPPPAGTAGEARSATAGEASRPGGPQAAPAQVGASMSEATGEARSAAGTPAPTGTGPSVRPGSERKAGNAGEARTPAGAGAPSRPGGARVPLAAGVAQPVPGLSGAARTPSAAPGPRQGFGKGWGGGLLAFRRRRRRPAEPAAPHDTLVDVRRLNVRRGRVEALRRVDLAVRAGETVALMGRNGAGKSTLLGSLVGMVAPTSGEVVVAGRTPHRSDPRELIRHAGLVPQDPRDLLYADTVEAECAAADSDAAAAPGTCRDLVTALLPGVADDTHPRDLSEGQRLALALAVVLTARPPLLLLDEPTRGLDYAAKARLVDVLRGLAADGHAIVLATHDVELAAELAHRVVILAGGEVVADGPTAEVVVSSPAFAPQVAKILAPDPWLTVAQVREALDG